MGWNHWYAHYRRVTDAMMREAADIMVASGMADVGYQYANIDDCWMNTDTDLKRQPDPARKPSRSGCTEKNEGDLQDRWGGGHAPQGTGGSVRHERRCSNCGHFARTRRPFLSEGFGRSTSAESQPASALAPVSTRCARRTAIQSSPPIRASAGEIVSPTMT